MRWRGEGVLLWGVLHTPLFDLVVLFGGAEEVGVDQEDKEEDRNHPESACKADGGDQKKHDHPNSADHQGANIHLHAREQIGGLFADLKAAVFFCEIDEKLAGFWVVAGLEVLCGFFEDGGAFGDACSRGFGSTDGGGLFGAFDFGDLDGFGFDDGDITFADHFGRFDDDLFFDHGFFGFCGCRRVCMFGGRQRSGLFVCRRSGLFGRCGGCLGVRYVFLLAHREKSLSIANQEKGALLKAQECIRCCVAFPSPRVEESIERLDT